MDSSFYEAIHIRLVQETLPITYKWLSVKLSIPTTQAKRLLETFQKEHPDHSCVSLHFVAFIDPTSGYQLLKLMYEKDLQDVDPSTILSTHVYALLPSILLDLRILHSIDQEILQSMAPPIPSTSSSTLPIKKVSPKPKPPPPSSIQAPPAAPPFFFPSNPTPPATSAPTRSPKKKTSPFLPSSQPPCPIPKNTTSHVPDAIPCPDATPMDVVDNPASPIHMDPDPVSQGSSAPAMPSQANGHHDPVLAALFDQPIPEPVVGTKVSKRRRVHRLRRVTKPMTYVDERGRMMTEDVTVEETYSVSEEEKEGGDVGAAPRRDGSSTTARSHQARSGGVGMDMGGNGATQQQQQQTSLLAFFTKKK